MELVNAKQQVWLISSQLEQFVVLLQTFGLYTDVII